jgi:branched-chain amino acid transport system ATP-binding protein
VGHILSLRNVSKRFGGLRASDGIDLALNAGELRCIIGPNGAGKSTLFKLIMGQLAVSSGEIFFREENITALPMWRRARRGLSIKMQVPGIYPDLSARENLRIAAQLHVSRAALPEVIERWLTRIGLLDAGETPARFLSHGQQQWLEIGMALSAEPALLLLDEPTAGMGPEETRATGELVKSINADGTTVLVIEHDMEFVRQVAQRVTVLHYGRVFAEGSVAEIEQHEDVMRIYLGAV